MKFYALFDQRKEAARGHSGLGQASDEQGGTLTSAGPAMCDDAQLAEADRLPAGLSLQHMTSSSAAPFAWQRWVIALM